MVRAEPVQVGVEGVARVGRGAVGEGRAGGGLGVEGAGWAPDDVGPAGGVGDLLGFARGGLLAAGHGVWVFNGLEEMVPGLEGREVYGTDGLRSVVDGRWKAETVWPFALHVASRVDSDIAAVLSWQAVHPGSNQAADIKMQSWLDADSPSHLLGLYSLETHGVMLDSRWRRCQPSSLRTSSWLTCPGSLIGASKYPRYGKPRRTSTLLSLDHQLPHSQPGIPPS